MSDKAQDLLLECIDRLNAGEQLDLDRILEEHTDVGPEVVRQLHAYVGVEEEQELSVPFGNLGEFTLRREIGRGGMGVVYEARQASLDRQVALKVLPPGIAADSKNFTRFIREARTAAQLNHPNVVPVHSVGLEQATPYYAMELVEGETLAQLIKRLKEARVDAGTPFGRRNSADYFTGVARAFADVAGGLQHAHSKGVIHRDVKPSNLILEGWPRAGAADTGGSPGPERSDAMACRLRILDFGLARIEGQESLTLTGDFVGTPAYMSPEQARHQKLPVDHRTDIYSVGATLYELLTHEPPFRGKSHQDTLSQIIERSPRPLRQLNPQVPAELETIVLRCLRKDAADRYGTAEALEQDLRRFVRGDPIEARPEGALEKLGRRVMRFRRLIVSAIVLVVLAMMGLAAANITIQQAHEQARRDLYLSNVRLAGVSLEQGNLRSVEEALKRAREADEPHWEWYYLKGLLRGPELTIRDAHPAGAFWLAWSDDGTGIVSLGSTVTNRWEMKFWDPGTGDELWRVPGDFRTLRVSARWLATVTDGKMTLWDVARRQKVKELAHDPQSLDFSPDDELLATAGEDGVRLWDPETGELVEALEADGHWNKVLWSPDGVWLAAATAGGNGEQPILKVWRREGRVVTEAKTWETGKGPLTWWDHDGLRLVASTKKGVEVRVPGTWVRDATAEERLSTPEGHLSRLTFSQDGRYAASVKQDVVLIRDMTGENGPVWLRGHTAPILPLAWNVRGELATGAFDGTLRIWDPRTAEQLAVLRGHRGELWDALAWSPDGTRLASGDAEGTLRIWSPWEKSGSSFTQPATLFVRFSPDGKYVLARAGRGKAREGGVSANAYDLETGERSFQLVDPGKRACESFAWHPDGHVVVGSGRKRIVVWNWPGGELLHGFEAHTRGVHQVDFNRYGDRVASASADGSVKVWDVTNLKSWQLTRTLDLRGDRSFMVAWNPEYAGRLAACGRRILRVWEDAASGKLAFEHETRECLVYSNSRMAWSPDGEWLALGGPEGEVLILDGRSGEVRKRLAGHVGEVPAVAWSPDGARLVTGGRDASVKIWEVERGAELLRLSHGDVVEGVAWSPDELHVASVPPLRVWDATAGLDED